MATYVSDGGVWGKCSLRQAIENNRMNIPDASELPGIPETGTPVEVPHVLMMPSP